MATSDENATDTTIYDDLDLSDRRKLICDVILAGVKNTMYPDPRFKKLVGTITPQSNPYPYTTCGTLPAYVAIQLGGIGDIVSGGLDGLRKAAKDAGAWVDADGTRRPQPGDLFGLLAEGVTDRDKGTIAHVGVILDASGTRWTTVDAGQTADGVHIGWACLQIDRDFDEDANTLSDNVKLMKQTYRVLAGWVDVDIYPFPKP